MKFPQILYVGRTNEGTKDEFFGASAVVGEIIEGDGPTEVAVYALQSIRTYQKEVRQLPEKAAKRGV